MGHSDAVRSCRHVLWPLALGPVAIALPICVPLAMAKVAKRVKVCWIRHVAALVEGDYVMLLKLSTL